MNGFELCQYLKKSDDLKHIPLLLLTAKSDNSSQRKGLTLGADDYINKPFEISSLQLKINNIIKTNKARKQFQLNYVTIKEHTEQTKSPQHEFITQVRISLKKNLNNSSYSITDLANSQNMSTSTLRRKLKQFFDQTFTEILKKSRMNKAKELLASDQQIQIIVEHCGYSSHSYFNKHFKEEFELSPKEIRADLTRKLVVS
jgi:AraC-like DNA-binding protein